MASRNNNNEENDQVIQENQLGTSHSEQEEDESSKNEESEEEDGIDNSLSERNSNEEEDTEFSEEESDQSGSIDRRSSSNTASQNNSGEALLNLRQEKAVQSVKNQPEFSVNELLSLAQKNKFPKKLFIFGKKKKSYTAVLYFFKCQTKFKKKHEEKIKFICKVIFIFKKNS